MASEVVSYMIIFSLGITMVVSIGFTMTNISTSVSETAADVELNQILINIKEIILQEIGSLSYDGTYSYKIQLNIPFLLSKQFPYDISVNESNGGFYDLVGSSTAIKPNFIIIKPLWLANTDNFIISGTINSLSTNPSLVFEKTSTTPPTIKLGN